MLMSIYRSVEKGEQNSGIPKEIELTASEAVRFIAEVNGVHIDTNIPTPDRQKITNKVKITQADSNGKIGSLHKAAIFGKKKITRERVKAIVQQWKDGIIEINYTYTTFSGGKYKYVIPMVICEGEKVICEDHQSGHCR